MSRVTVIIPNYNHERYLQLRIDSVLNQTYRDFEVIILDDCSTDNSKDIIEKYRSNEKISAIVYNEKNSGSTFHQWKKGLELAKGEYIWIAESDDFADATLLEVLVKPFSIYPDLVISYCRSYSVDDDSKVKGLTLWADHLDNVRWTKDYVVTGDIEVKNYLKYRNTIPNASSVVFKKPKEIDRVLKTNLRFTGDWFFWKNLLKKNGRIYYCHVPLNYFRSHASTTRSGASSTTIDKEIIRFREYMQFVPGFMLNPFENRYRWMMEEWLIRTANLNKTIYRYIPYLHPALALRYYFYLAKRLFKSKLSTGLMKIGKEQK
jgi:glycosyltransferase involved in cell wall biosynthesis